MTQSFYSEKCAQVAKAWLAKKVKYNWGRTGPGGFRADCSGFVSAAWGYTPPGYVVNTMPGKKIAASELKMCDALKWAGTGASGHIALFWYQPFLCCRFLSSRKADSS